MIAEKADHEKPSELGLQFPACEHVTMGETDFEGTVVLEQLAAIGRVEDFFDAVDSDDEAQAASLMREAGIDASTIARVLKMMRESDGEH